MIAHAEGLRIYGSGTVSSKGESVYCLKHPGPNRLGFDLPRTMRTRYRIDAFQETYFVIDSFEQLFAATEPAPGAVLASDHVIHRGVGTKKTGLTQPRRAAA